MGLGDFINRYIVEVRPSGDEKPRAEDPPEVRAARVEVVPGKRNVKDVVADVEARLGALDPALLAEVEGQAPDPGGAATISVEPPARPARPASAPVAARLAPPPTPVAPAPPAAPEKDPLDDGGDPPVSVEQVYAASKLGRPAHGFSLEKIAGMLADPRLAALDQAARAGAIAVVLEASGVQVEDVVQDAAARDAALDKFETFLTDKLVSLQVETDQDRARLEEEIERLLQRKRDELARLGERVVAKERELARFRRVKREEERRLFAVVRAFTTENPISVTPFSSAGPAPAAAEELGKADTGRFKRPQD